MALETTSYQCPACDGKLRFDSGTGGLACDYCGSRFTVDEIEGLNAAKREKAEEKARKKAASEKPYAQDGDNRAGAIPEMEARTADDASIGEGTASGAVAGATASASATAAAAASGAAVAAAAATETASSSRAKKKRTGEKDPIKEYLRRSHWDGDEEGMREFTCSTCGAQLIVDQTTAVSSCPYCGNNAVLPGQLSNTLKPDFVIPFKLDKDAAIKALNDYYKGKMFLPKQFTEKNHMEEIQGVYVPFWLYTGTVEGDACFDAEKKRSWTDSDNEYIEIEHYEVTRSGKAHFERVPVDGSTKMPDAHMDSIEPYNFNELKPFKVAFLPGYLTDRYDESASKCRKRADKRMKNSFNSMIRDTVAGYDEVRKRTLSSGLSFEGVSYALLPVWMLHTRFEDQDYLFAMNGQTGKLIGDLPVQRSRVVAHFFKIFTPIAVVLALIALL